MCRGPKEFEAAIRIILCYARSSTGNHASALRMVSQRLIAGSRPRCVSASFPHDVSCVSAMRLLDREVRHRYVCRLYWPGPGARSLCALSHSAGPDQT